jgi:GNAT superfamily N-acetyltransferase
MSSHPTPERLQRVIARLDTALSTIEDELEDEAISSEADEPSSSPSSGLLVIVGTSQLVADDSQPDLVGRICRMVNSSYFESNRELLPADSTGFERLTESDVLNRLAMGDAGPRANRVLHLALRSGELVGCCSSTFQPPWTTEGCGHWGLLVVDKAAQGTGVASALVSATCCCPYRCRRCCLCTSPLGTGRFMHPRM